MPEEIIYLGQYENTLDFRLDSDGTALNLQEVTEISANIAGVDVVSANGANDLIRWNGVGFVTGEIRCRLGPAVGLMQGKFPCYFIVVDPTNPGGVVFGPVTLDIVALP